MATDKSLANKAVDIKGRQYVLVSDRVLYFNEKYENGSIATELVSVPDAQRIIVRAFVRPDASKTRVFTAYSQAVIGEGYINKTAALENAETSAVGRALAFMGIGVIDSVASADEIKKAETAPQSRQKPHQPARSTTIPQPASMVPEKDATTELKAAKDRTISLLKLLGHTNLKTKKEYEDTVFDLTGYILADKDIDIINEKLAALVEKQDDNK